MIREIASEIKCCLKKILGLIVGENRELNKLSKLSRYIPGTYLWKSAILEFPDAKSFVFTFRELFLEHIYKFKTDSKKPFIIDCGANIGLSIIYFKEQFPDARIVAFEPEKTIFQYLKKNIESIGVKNVELINKAVWSDNEELHFNNEGADASRLALLGNQENKFRSTYAVEAVRLSNFINERVDFLKLDIEGAEVDVMKEIEPKLKFVDQIFIEYHSFEQPIKQSLDAILSILTRNNFRYYIDAPVRLKKMPFIDDSTFLSFDFLLNIYARQT